MQRRRAFVFVREVVSSREANAKKRKEEADEAIPRVQSERFGQKPNEMRTL